MNIDLTFKEYEPLPYLTFSIFAHELCTNTAQYHALKNYSDYYECLKSHSAAMTVLRQSQDAIKQGKIEIDNTTAVAPEQDDYLSVLAVPSSFFDWVQSEGNAETTQAKKHIDRAKSELRTIRYERYTIDTESVSKLINEPTWEVHQAVMYLHGFQPSEIGVVINKNIVNSSSGMKQTLMYLRNAESIGKISIHTKDKLWGMLMPNLIPESVEPLIFMEWAATLGLQFPNLISPNKNTDINTAVKKRGRPPKTGYQEDKELGYMLCLVEHKNYNYTQAAKAVIQRFGVKGASSMESDIKRLQKSLSDEIERLNKSE